MHTFYKEHEGSYAVAVPWPETTEVTGVYHQTQQWHVLFTGLSLADAMYVVRYLNGGGVGLGEALTKLLPECAA